MLLSNRSKSGKVQVGTDAHKFLLAAYHPATAAETS